MQRGELAHHVGEGVIEFCAVGHAVHERKVLGKVGLPVDAVHARVVKIIAVQAPRIGEHLPPALAWLERELERTEIHFGFFESGGRLCGGVDDIEVVRAAEQNFFSVRGKLIR